MNVAAIYCRLSKEDHDKLKEGDDSASIQNQKMLLVDYALDHGFTVYDIYSDDDYKGFDNERPDFNRMLIDAKLKKFNIIICKTQSRFTRDMELVEKYIHGMFPLLGIRFIGVVDHVDTNIKGNKKARQIYGLVNEWYSEDLSENIRSVFLKKMQKGEFLGAFACYGYTKDPKDNHRLIIDEPAARVVKKIFAYYVQGYGNRQICYMLQEEGIPTPCSYKASLGLNFHHPSEKYSYGKQYGLWSPNTIRKILTNRVYIGEMVQGRERKVSYKSKKVIALAKEEWIIVPNCHEPIIEKEVFDLAQELIKGRRYARSKSEDGNKSIALLSGRLRCLDCGNKLTRINGAQKYVYYYCSLHKRSHGTQCTSHSINNSKLEELLESKIRTIIKSHLESNQLDDQLYIHEDNEKVLVRKTQQLRKIIELLEKTKKAYAMAYIDKSNDIITDTEYRELKSSLDTERESLEKQNSLVSEEINALQSVSIHHERKEGLVKKYSDFIKLDHEIINEFIDYLEVGEKDGNGNQEVIIHWRF